MFKKILIAHDLTTEANHALRRGAQLARQFGAELVIQHTASGADQAHAEATLQGLRADIGAPDAQILIRKGKPSEALLQSVTDTGTDLLVAGVHHQGRPEAFSGTNLERLARETRVPLLMVKRNPQAPYRSALVALDSSLCASHALVSAYRLLPGDGELHAVNIYDQALQLPPAKQEEHLRIQRALLQQLIDDELAQQAEGGPDVQLDVRPGTLAGSLDEVIGGHRPELLVLGQHSRSRLSEALLGSLPAYYLRQPVCDLLLVK